MTEETHTPNLDATYTVVSASGATVSGDFLSCRAHITGEFGWIRHGARIFDNGAAGGIRLHHGGMKNVFGGYRTTGPLVRLSDWDPALLIRSAETDREDEALRAEWRAAAAARKAHLEATDPWHLQRAAERRNDDLLRAAGYTPPDGLVTGKAMRRHRHRALKRLRIEAAAAGEVRA